MRRGQIKNSRIGLSFLRRTEELEELKKLYEKLEKGEAEMKKLRDDSEKERKKMKEEFENERVTIAEQVTKVVQETMMR